MSNGYVYFQRHVDNAWVRIGYTNGGGSRSKRTPGFEPIGMRPGIQEDEDALHRAFAECRAGYDKSTYEGIEIETFVCWLLGLGYLAETEREADLLPSMPIDGWHPDLMKQDASGAPTLFSALPLGERLHAARSDYIQFSSASDEWNTPKSILDKARLAMGSIDTDPATNPWAQRTVQAKVWYHRLSNGLDITKPWVGNVWLNPPYGRGDGSAKDFIHRLLAEMKEENVRQAITCLSVNSMTTEWFQPIWDGAVLHAISRGRPDFVNPKRDRSSPSKGIILSYLGDKPNGFADAFSSWRLIETRRP